MLAAYIDRVRDMRAKAGAGLDPKAYKDAMKTLEDEMMNLKNTYERELSRLRLKDVKQKLHFNCKFFFGSIGLSDRFCFAFQ